MPRIKTNIGEYQYRTKFLYPGMKKINREVAKDNLLLLQQILDTNQLKFGLLYGTLLGAVREQDFIEHDEDIDLFMLEEDREKFFDLFFEIETYGFKLIRYDLRGLVSIIRNNEYIDIYFFNVLSPGIRFCSGLCIKESFLLETVTFGFLGSKFLVPSDYIGYLEFEYGKNWMEPIVFSDFNVSRFKVFCYMLKNCIKSFLPEFIYMKFKINREKIMIKEFYNKLAEAN